MPIDETLAALLQLTAAQAQEPGSDESELPVSPPLPVVMTREDRDAVAWTTMTTLQEIRDLLALQTGLLRYITRAADLRLAIGDSRAVFGGAPGDLNGVQFTNAAVMRIYKNSTNRPVRVRVRVTGIGDNTITIQARSTASDGFLLDATVLEDTTPEALLLPEAELWAAPASLGVGALRLGIEIIDPLAWMTPGDPAARRPGAPD